MIESKVYLVCDTKQGWWPVAAYTTALKAGIHIDNWCKTNPPYWDYDRYKIKELELK